MPSYNDAKRLADCLVKAIAPYCERIEIAGSVRRKKADVKDIEIVAIPRWEERPDMSSLFAEPQRVNLLYKDWVV
jgi:DNA polymerase/3'-5' exonuclease PolX